MRIRAAAALVLVLAASACASRVIPAPVGGVANLNATNALGYSRYSPYGFNGRFLYARFNYSW